MQARAPTSVSAGCSVTVRQYGATPSSADNAQAFQEAINAGVGHTVCVPAGTWKLASTVDITSQEVFEGAGRGRTFLVETHPAHNLLRVSADGTIVQHMTLDTQTFNGGIPFASGASHVTLRNARILSGNQPGHFAVYFAGPKGATVSAPVYSTGNVITDVVINDTICDDGLSWSFQRDGTIDNVQETGSRLALYVDNGTTVTNYRYRPGPCTKADDAFWITPPSRNITIDNFVSAGQGGEVCPNIQSGRSCADIVIANERATDTLHIGNVIGLSVRGSAVGGVAVRTSTGASGTWASSTPITAHCDGRPIAIAGLTC